MLQLMRLPEEKLMLLSDEETAQDQGSVSMTAIQSRNASYQFNKLQPLWELLCMLFFESFEPRFSE